MPRAKPLRAAPPPSVEANLHGDGGIGPRLEPDASAGISGGTTPRKGVHARATGGAGEPGGSSFAAELALGVSGGAKAPALAGGRSDLARAGGAVVSGGPVTSPVGSQRRAIPRAGARVTREGLGAGAITRSGSSRTLPSRPATNFRGHNRPRCTRRRRVPDAQSRTKGHRRATRSCLRRSSLGRAPICPSRARIDQRPRCARRGPHS